MKDRPDMASNGGTPPNEETSRLADSILGADGAGRTEFVRRLESVLPKTCGKEILLIHNPGGWGDAALDDLLDWERSIVTGVTETMSELGRSCLVAQYFRSGNSLWQHMRDVRKEARFFLQGESAQAETMAAELRFLVGRCQGLKVVLVGASQGAAFSNTVMRHLGGFPGVYSIELGTFFPHMGRRVITERTLAIDGNGLMPDPMCHRNLWAGFRAYVTAPYRWAKSRLQGKPQRFTYCINAPGHEYRWEYPEVHTRIRDFLQAAFGQPQRQPGGEGLQ